MKRLTKEQAIILSCYTGWTFLSDTEGLIDKAITEKLQQSPEAAFNEAKTRAAFEADFDRVCAELTLEQRLVIASYLGGNYWGVELEQVLLAVETKIGRRLERKSFSEDRLIKDRFYNDFLSVCY